MGEFGGLVVVKPEVHAQRDFQKALGELQVRGRGVERIAAEDEEDRHLACVNILRQFRQGVFCGAGFDGVGVHDGGAYVSERRVHGMGQGVHGRRLRMTRDDQGSAAMALQIAHQRIQPGIGDRRIRGLHRKTKRSCEGAREMFDFARADRQPMIGHAAGEGWCAFDDVEPVHLRGGSLDAAPLGEVARVADAGRPLIEEIGVPGRRPRRPDRSDRRN